MSTNQRPANPTSVLHEEAPEATKRRGGLKEAEVEYTHMRLEAELRENTKLELKETSQFWEIYKL